ncbi:DUF3618 domain-containing protein [Devosia oryziradicis]|uniref:DUF3618 domain-containing protein n=1 Tax=Devosia oryziradicis TaxID=2801335 RepID=A0ABX7BTY1_9HYPH|nr:DUF3618 domain-containing protein [Devosia oryziradicis]QQR34997.1 DUF3618 domain-containing protein [Devosia oryziradicis]
MAYDSEKKSAAELQLELEQQRSRVESTIDEIQQKLSPGQLVDELLAYTKGGGGEFISSLQKNVTANPLPVALLGVSLAWLMAKPATGSEKAADREWDRSINTNRGYGSHSESDGTYVDYPVATISGTTLRRQRHVEEDGRWYSEFSDDLGTTYRAPSDSLGKRAGHFTDKAGNRFKGFANAAGERIEHFQDEAGNLLDETAGWASHVWHAAQDKLHDARDSVKSLAASGREKAGATGTQARDQFSALNETILHQFRDQPLIGGALAFAFGAALGAALPHTPQEDAVMGEAAEALREKASEQAHELYEKGRDKVAELHETVAAKGGELYQQAKDGLEGSGNIGH